jgi:hypothetical protein
MEIRSVDKELIPKINKTMGFELTADQINFITKGINTYPVNTRQLGRTTAYIIKLALDDMVIDLNDIRYYADRRGNYEYNMYFRQEFVRIYCLLRDNGLKVCTILDKNIKPLERSALFFGGEKIEKDNSETQCHTHYRL